MYRKQIEKYIEEHENEIIEDVIRLCRINSQKTAYKEGMPFGEGAARTLNVALDMASAAGFSITNYDNYVGAIDLNDKEKGLDILAHLDVVPEGEGWSVTEAFDPVVKDGKIYGRGTSDDKGPAVAAFYALKAVKELGIPLKKNVRLILGTDEECGSACIEHYYKIEKEAPMTFTPDGEYPVVNIEKGRLDGHFVGELELEDTLPRLVRIEAGTKINVVPPKAKAVLEGFDFKEVEKTIEEVSKETGVKFILDLDPEFSITALGENAHASTPDKGKNAITALLTLLARLDFAPSKRIDVIKALVKLMPHGDLDGTNLGIKVSDKESGSLTLAFSILNLDDKSLDGYFDSRCPISTDGEATIKICKQKFADIGLEFTNDKIKEPHIVDSDSDFVRTLNKCYEEYTGRKGGCISIGGGTYVHNIKNGVCFGAVYPETDTKMHGADEFMPIEELLISAKIFAQVIVDLCS